MFRQALEMKESHPSISYFEIVRVFSGTMTSLLFVYVLHMKFDNLQKMLEIIAHCSLFPSNWGRLEKVSFPRSFYNIIIIIITFVIFDCLYQFPQSQTRVVIILTHLIWIFGSLIFPFFDKWQFPSFYSTYLAHGRYALLIDIHSRAEVTINEVTSRLPDICIVVFEVISCMCNWLMEGSYYSAMGICTVTLWTATNNFMKRLNNTTSLKQEFVHSKAFEELREKFYELLKLSKAINNVWNMVYFWLLFDTGMSLSTKLDGIRNHKDYVEKAFIIYSVGYTAAILIMSAECKRKVFYSTK